MLGAHKIVTGHNADDIAETVLMNRIIFPSAGACLAYLCDFFVCLFVCVCVCVVVCVQCCVVMHRVAALRAHHHRRRGPIPRCKPFKYTYEKEIVMYVPQSARVLCHCRTLLIGGRYDCCDCHPSLTLVVLCV